MFPPAARMNSLPFTPLRPCYCPTEHALIPSKPPIVILLRLSSLNFPFCQHNFIIFQSWLIFRRLNCLVPAPVLLGRARRHRVARQRPRRLQGHHRALGGAERAAYDSAARLPPGGARRLARQPAACSTLAAAGRAAAAGDGLAYCTFRLHS